MMDDEHGHDITVTVDHGRRRLFMTHRGVLDKNAAIESYKAIHGIDGFDPAYDTLADYRGVTRVDLEFADLQAILREAKGIERRIGRGALLIGDDTGRYAFAKLFCMISSTFGGMGIRYQAFRTAEEAEHWLDGGSRPA